MFSNFDFISIDSSKIDHISFSQTIMFSIDNFNRTQIYFSKLQTSYFANSYFIDKRDSNMIDLIKNKKEIKI